jgi:hypothetical protein
VADEDRAVDAATADALEWYEFDTEPRELRQAELISGLIQWDYDPDGGEQGNVRRLKHGFAVIVSQDCDLLRYFEAQPPIKEAVLNGILILEARLADDAAKAATKLNSAEWRTARQNKNERYHFLPECPPVLDRLKQGFPALFIDFRRFFSMTPKELDRQCEAATANRRCRLRSPYREQLQSRLAYYLQRVAIPGEGD